MAEEAAVRRPVIAGNWKMHGSAQAIASLLDGMLPRLGDGRAEVIVFPPAVYLAQVVERLRESVVAAGAQNLHPEPQGAFTGEIAAEMVADVGARHALVGHSERRQHFGETDDEVAAKFLAAQRAGLTPMLCLGETLEQRRSGEGAAIEVVLAQLDRVLSVAGARAMRDAMLAYEPVWAIGTGRNASAEDAQTMHAAIRVRLAELEPAIGASVRILYGGSVSPQNAAELFAGPDVDGALVGGASLDAERFAAIYEAVAPARPVPRSG